MPDYYGSERRRSTGDHCPMTPDQVQIMLANQQKLINDVAELKRYLFAGRVVFATVACIALSFDWVREHLPIIKSLFDPK
jgi:hypothetical protein